MKIIHYDGERLAVEIKSDSVFYPFTMYIFLQIILLIFFVLTADVSRTRLVRCEKTEPEVVNCQITTTLFWGAIRQVNVVNGVRSVKLTRDGDDDTEGVATNQVFLVTDTDTEVLVAVGLGHPYETKKVKNSLAQFLESELKIHNIHMDYVMGNDARFVFWVLTFANFCAIFLYPYQVRIILNRTMNEALLIRNFVLNTHRQTFTLNLVFLQIKEETDSDDVTSYGVFLNIHGKRELQYTLKQSSNRQEIEDYWRLNPDMQLLKKFVRSEENLPPSQG